MAQVQDANKPCPRALIEVAFLVAGMMLHLDIVAGATDSNQIDLVSVPGVIIRSIEFIGNKHYSDERLHKMIGIELGERYDPFLAESGRRTIIDVYKKVGYSFVQVSFDAVQAGQGRLIYTINEGPRVRIKQIKFVGNRAFSSSTLSKVLKTKQRTWLVMPGYYSEQVLTEDLEALRGFYYKHGYLGYEVALDKQFTPDKTGLIVVFKISEGRPYQIKEIILTGNKAFPTDQLVGMLRIGVGQRYKKDMVSLDVKKILDLYRQKGFIDAQVNHIPRLSPDVNDNHVSLEITISEGRQFRIGRIEITGNDTTQDKAIRRVLDEYGFVPGQLYNAKMAPLQGESLMEKYVQMAIMADQVLIRPEVPADGEPNRRDVRVDVTEGLTGLIMPGVGVSSDHGIIGQLIYRQKNFDITNWPRSWSELFSMKAFRGGGQTLEVSLQPGTVVSYYSVVFSEPYLLDRPIGLDLVGSSYRRFLESYDEDRLRALVELEQRMPDGWRRILGLRAEAVGVINLDYDAPQEIRDVEGTNDIYGIEVGLGLTKVDDIYQPHTGFRVRGSYEQVFGDFDFGLLTASASKYFTIYEDPLGKKTVLAASLQAGTTVGTAPPFERFYVGGMGKYAVRGFDYRGISCRGLQVFDPDSDPNLVPRYIDPIGSKYAVVANLELIVPLVGDNLSLLAFTDTGTIEDGHWRVSAGGGIQIQVPQFFGSNVPIRFEYGVPLVYSDLDETRRFSFTMGGMFR